VAAVDGGEGAAATAASASVVEIVVIAMMKVTISGRMWFTFVLVVFK
jgi:hypothetical protein